MAQTAEFGRKGPKAEVSNHAARRYSSSPSCLNWHQVDFSNSLYGKSANPKNPKTKIQFLKNNLQTGSSCRNAGKAQNFAPVRVHMGEFRRRFGVHMGNSGSTQPWQPWLSSVHCGVSSRCRRLW